MNTVGIGTTAAFANQVTLFNPVGKSAVGLENADAKEDVLAPVEEPTKTAETFNRNDRQNQQQKLLGVQSNPDDASQGSEARSDEQVDNGAVTGDIQKKQEAQEQQVQEQLDRQKIQELAARDREVRAHEQAHAAVGGRFAGAPSYSFQRGPDGVNYAVEGEVPITLPSSGDDPQATLSAAEQVRRAALAPAEPSAQDQRIAAQASQLIVEARSDIVKLDNEQRQEKLESETSAKKQKAEEKELQEKQARNDEVQQQRQQQIFANNQRRASQFTDQLSAVNSIGAGSVVGSLLDQQA